MSDRFEGKTALMDTQTPPRRLAGLMPPFFLASVRGRIVFGFALLVIVMAAGAASSAWLTREHSSELSQMEQRTPTVSLLQDGFGEGAYAMALLELYVATGDETVVPEIRSSLAAATENARQAQVQEEIVGHDERATSLGDLV